MIYNRRRKASNPSRLLKRADFLRSLVPATLLGLIKPPKNHYPEGIFI